MLQQNNCCASINLPYIHKYLLQELRLKFGKNFDVEASDGCYYDRVRITDNYGFDEEYCGSDVDFGRIATTGTTTVTFTTDSSVTGRGFLLSWRTK